MRKLVWALAALAAGAPAASGQGGAWGDKLFRGQTAHDFGSVPHGSQLYHRFPMTNIWAVPVELSSIRTSCGCVTVTPSPRLLQPRESGFVDVTMDTHRFTGPRSVSIYITLGPQYVSTAMLRVSAYSRADVVLNPGQIHFGVVQRGQTPEQTLDVEYAGALDWRLQDVDKGGAPVDVTVQELYRQTGRAGYRLKAVLQAEAPAGQLKYELHLRTNDPASPLVPVPVEATVQAPLTVKPGTIQFEGVKVGETVTKRVNVYGSRPFKIVGIDGLGNGVQADLPPAAASVQTITITYQPAAAGELKGQLQIRTDLPGQGPVMVELAGTTSQ
jgi:hypothetical protein